MDTDSLRANAVIRRDAALAEARRWDDFVRSLDELVGHKGESPEQVPPKEPYQETPVKRGGTKAAETNAVATLIVSEQGPTETNDLLRRLSERGIEVGGKDPRATLWSRIGKGPSLEYERGIGWRLRNQARQKEEAPEQSPDQDSEASGLTLEPPSSDTIRGPVNPEAGGGT